MTSTINTVNNIIDEVKALYGANVNVFGQPTTLSTAPTQDDFLIDIVDVLEALKDYEFDIDGVVDELNEYYRECEESDEVCDIDTTDYNAVIDFLADSGLCDNDYDRADNSYNWSSPVNHDFNFEVYKATDGGVFVTLDVHRFGDVRGNYTDTCLLKFDSYDCFFEVLCECSKYNQIDVDGVTYNVDVNIFSDGFEVFDVDGSYICTAYGCDADDIAENIREKIA